MRALAKDPALRFQSAREMADELERVRRGLGVSQDTAAGDDGDRRRRRPSATRRARPQPAGPTPPPEVPQAKRSALPWMLVLAAARRQPVVGYVVYQQLQGTDLVRCRTCATFTTAQARQQLESDGFTTKVQKVPAPSIDKGRIVVTDRRPAARRSKKGSTVTIKVGRVDVDHAAERSGRDLRARRKPSDRGRRLHPRHADSPMASKLNVGGRRIDPRRPAWLQAAAPVVTL